MKLTRLFSSNLVDITNRSASLCGKFVTYLVTNVIHIQSIHACNLCQPRLITTVGPIVEPRRVPCIIDIVVSLLFTPFTEFIYTSRWSPSWSSGPYIPRSVASLTLFRTSFNKISTSLCPACIFSRLYNKPSTCSSVAKTVYSLSTVKCLVTLL